METTVPSHVVIYATEVCVIRPMERVFMDVLTDLKLETRRVIQLEVLIFMVNVFKADSCIILFIINEFKKYM